MNELPSKLEHSYPRELQDVATKCNQIIDYLQCHTLPQEIKSWAYTFLGDTANIRCGNEIKHVTVFRREGREMFKFTLPDNNKK
jgi:hypothetical protein